MNNNCLKKNLLMLLASILINSSLIYTQDWENMDDSTYYQIVENRFCKGNFIVGIGGTIKTGYEDLSFTGVGVRAKAGYFVSNRWVISTDIDYYFAWVQETDEEGEGTFHRYLIGLNGRHYFKPKHRTIFIEFGPLFGNETNQTDEIDSIDSYNNFVYGGKIGIGVSVFIRHVELELIAGIRFYGNDYSTDNLYSNMYQLLQINLSYLFDKQRKKKY